MSNPKSPGSESGMSSDDEGECHSGCVQTNELIIRKKTLNELRKFRKAFLTYSSYKKLNELDGADKPQGDGRSINNGIENKSISDLYEMEDKARALINKPENNCLETTDGCPLSCKTNVFTKLRRSCLQKKINKADKIIQKLIQAISKCNTTKESGDNPTEDRTSKGAGEDSRNAPSGNTNNLNRLKTAKTELEKAKEELDNVQLGKGERKSDKLKKSMKKTQKAKEKNAVKILKRGAKQCNEDVDNYAKDSIGLELTNRWQKAVLYCGACALVLLFGAPLLKQIVINLLSMYDAHWLEVLRQTKPLKELVNSVIALRKILLPMFTAVLAAFTTVCDWRVKRIDALLDGYEDSQKKLLKQSHYYAVKKSWPGVFMALTVITTLCTAMSALLSI